MTSMLTDATFASLRRDIDAAREALIAAAREDPTARWHPSRLKSVARNGWSADVMNLALESLVDDGTLASTDDLLVYLSR